MGIENRLAVALLGAFVGWSAGAAPKVRYWYAQPYYGAIYNEVNLPLGPFETEVKGTGK